MGWHCGKFRGFSRKCQEFYTPSASTLDTEGRVLQLCMIFKTLDAFYGFAIGFLRRGSDFECITYWQDYCLQIII